MMHVEMGVAHRVRSNAVIHVVDVVEHALDALQNAAVVQENVLVDVQMDVLDVLQNGRHHFHDGQASCVSNGQNHLFQASDNVNVENLKVIVESDF